METLVIGIVIVALFGQIVNFVVVGRFIDLIEDMHKREYRKNNTKSWKILVIMHNGYWQIPVVVL